MRCVECQQQQQQQRKSVHELTTPHLMETETERNKANFSLSFYLNAQQEKTN